MNDTKPVAVYRFRQLIMAKNQEERLRMGCSMFNSSKQIVRDAILNQRPETTPQEMKREIFLRFYGMEFDKAAKEKILNRITERGDTV